MSDYEGFTVILESEWHENEQLFGLFQLFLFRNSPPKTTQSVMVIAC